MTYTEVQNKMQNMKKFIVATEHGDTSDERFFEMGNMQILSIIECESKEQAIKYCIEEWTQTDYKGNDYGDISEEKRHQLFEKMWKSIDDLYVWEVTSSK